MASRPRSNGSSWAASSPASPPQNISSAFAYVTTSRPPDKRAKQFGYLAASFGMGFIIGIGRRRPTSAHNQFTISLWAAAVLSWPTRFMVFSFFQNRCHPSAAQSPPGTWLNPLGSLTLLRRTPNCSVSHRHDPLLSCPAISPRRLVLYTQYRTHGPSATSASPSPSVGVSTSIVPGC